MNLFDLLVLFNKLNEPANELNIFKLDSLISSTFILTFVKVEIVNEFIEISLQLNDVLVNRFEYEQFP